MGLSIRLLVLLGFFEIGFASLSASAVSICVDEYTEQNLVRMKELSGFEPAEGHGPVDDWPVDGPVSVYRTAAESYSDSFYAFFNPVSSLSQEDYFKSWLISRRKQGGTTHVLDLFGGGFFVADQSLANSITGFRYGPIDRRKLRSEGYSTRNIPPEILGDAFNPKTWAALDESMKARGIQKMDLVTMKPVAAWPRLSFHNHGDADVYAIRFLTYQVIRRLSQSGEFYFAVAGFGTGDNATNPVLLEFVDEISRTTGYQLEIKSELSEDADEAPRTVRIKGALRPKRR